MDKVLEHIRVTARLISEDEYTQLQAEEYLLAQMVRSPKFSLDQKKSIFAQIERLNKRQLEILGQK